MIIYSINPSINQKYWLKSLDTTYLEPANKNSIKVPNFLKPANKKTWL